MRVPTRSDLLFPLAVLIRRASLAQARLVSGLDVRDRVEALPVGAPRQQQPKPAAIERNPVSGSTSAMSELLHRADWANRPRLAAR